jgi:hypothetical protein
MCSVVQYSQTMNPICTFCTSQNQAYSQITASLCHRLQYTLGQHFYISLPRGQRIGGISVPCDLSASNRARIFKPLGIPRIASKEPIPPGCVAWWNWYDNPTPTRFLAPIDCSKIPAQYSTHGQGNQFRMAYWKMDTGIYMVRQNTYGFLLKDLWQNRKTTLSFASYWVL